MHKTGLCGHVLDKLTNGIEYDDWEKVARPKGEANRILS